MFNQSQVLAMVTGIVFSSSVFVVRMPYSAAMSADATTASLAGDYLLCSFRRGRCSSRSWQWAPRSAPSGISSRNGSLVRHCGINMIMAPF